MAEWTDDQAQWYADNYGEYATNTLAIDELDIDANAVVVDIGCGTGAALRHASTKVTHGRLVGVDPVARMVEIARARAADHEGAGRIEIHQAPAHHLPLADGSADLVLAFDSFDHWGASHQAGGLAEVRRILRPTGRFVVVKDRGVASVETTTAFLTALETAGFHVVGEQVVSDQGVVFTMWTAVIR